MGDKEQTFKWLEQAYKEKTELLLYLRVDPTRVVDTRPRAAYIKVSLPTAHRSPHIAH